MQLAAKYHVSVMQKTFYITTPLYYVNASPHIGHSYTNVAADCLARYHRLKGEPVFLLTGTDEHGQKIEQAAAASGVSPQAYADEVVGHFRALWELLNVSYDDFIRTTEPRHTTAVQQILTRLYQQGKLTQAAYQGWYCTPDETFWTEAELASAGNASRAGDSAQSGSGTLQGAGQARVPLCPSCQRPLEPVKEDGWYLELRAAQPWLRNFVKTHPTFIQPSSRYNELLGMLEQPLPEHLCITRPRSRVSWGISVPFSTDHVTYVWFDALLNYITAPGYIGDLERFARLWPAEVHFIGKDILKHHAIYWPIILHAIGFTDEQMPKLVFAHGWWKIGEQKMSKSLGNIVDPSVVVRQLLKGQPYAADVYRYFLLREVPFGQDGSFSEEAIFTRFQVDLANDLGNLVNRTLSMIDRYFGGKIPHYGAGAREEDYRSLEQSATKLYDTIDPMMSRCEFSKALETVMQVISEANRYIEVKMPWKLAKEDPKRLETVLHVLAEVLRIVAIVLEPFMPSVASAIWEQLGCAEHPRRLQDAARWPWLTANQPIGAHPILFPRSDTAKK